jgi:rubrerythrin
MALLVTAAELIDVAVGIEKSGAAFYEYLVNTTRDLRAQVMYKYLADQEREHIKIFQMLRTDVGDYSSPMSSSDEYAEYLEALVKSAVFGNDMMARKMAEKASSDSEAIDIAIRAEKDSILFYVAIKDLVRRSDVETIEKIVREEKSHLTQLSEFKKGPGKA